MKIYNKIILGWDDSTQTYDKVIEEDAFQYNGEIYELQNGGDRTCPDGAGPCTVQFSADWMNSPPLAENPTSNYPDYCADLCNEAYAHPYYCDDDIEYNTSCNADNIGEICGNSRSGICTKNKRHCEDMIASAAHWSYRSLGNVNYSNDSFYWRADFCFCGDTEPHNLFPGGIDWFGFWGGYWNGELGIKWHLGDGTIFEPDSTIGPPHITHYYQTNMIYPTGFNDVKMEIVGPDWSCDFTIDEGGIDLRIGCTDYDDPIGVPACNYGYGIGKNHGYCIYEDCDGSCACSDYFTYDETAPDESMIGMPKSNRTGCTAYDIPWNPPICYDFWECTSLYSCTCGNVGDGTPWDCPDILGCDDVTAANYPEGCIEGEDCPNYNDGSCCWMNCWATGTSPEYSCWGNQDFIIRAPDEDDEGSDPPTEACEPVEFNGYTYEVVAIGQQCWFAENLRSAQYRGGSDIPTGLSNGTGGGWRNTTEGAYCIYTQGGDGTDDDPANAEIYGYLYNWFAVNHSIEEVCDSGDCLCPEGWYVPTDEEIMELELFIGMDPNDLYGGEWRGYNEGSKIAGRADLWDNGNLENSPEFGTAGLDVIPTGHRNYYSGTYTEINSEGYIWSSTPSDDLDSGWKAYWRRLRHDQDHIARFGVARKTGLPVRCFRPYPEGIVSSTDCNAESLGDECGTGGTCIQGYDDFCIGLADGLSESQILGCHQSRDSCLNDPCFGDEWISEWLQIPEHCTCGLNWADTFNIGEHNSECGGACPDNEPPGLYEPCYDDCSICQGSGPPPCSDYGSECGGTGCDDFDCIFPVQDAYCIGFPQYDDDCTADNIGTECPSGLGPGICTAVYNDSCTCQTSVITGLCWTGEGCCDCTACPTVPTFTITFTATHTVPDSGVENDDMEVQITNTSTVTNIPAGYGDNPAAVIDVWVWDFGGTPSDEYTLSNCNPDGTCAAGDATIEGEDNTYGHFAGTYANPIVRYSAPGTKSISLTSGNTILSNNATTTNSADVYVYGCCDSTKCNWIGWEGVNECVPNDVLCLIEGCNGDCTCEDAWEEWNSDDDDCHVTNCAGNCGAPPDYYDCSGYDCENENPCDVTYCFNYPDDSVDCGCDNPTQIGLCWNGQPYCVDVANCLSEPTISNLTIVPTAPGASAGVQGDFIFDVTHTISDLDATIDDLTYEWDFGDGSATYSTVNIVDNDLNTWSLFIDNNPAAVVDGNFTPGNWHDASQWTVDNTFILPIIDATNNTDALQFKQNGISIEDGKSYKVGFNAWSNDDRNIEVHLMEDGDDFNQTGGMWDNLGLNETVSLTSTPTYHTFDFIASNVCDNSGNCINPSARLNFLLGNHSGIHTIGISTISIIESPISHTYTEIGTETVTVTVTNDAMDNDSNYWSGIATATVDIGVHYYGCMTNTACNYLTPGTDCTIGTDCPTADDGSCTSPYDDGAGACGAPTIGGTSIICDCDQTCTATGGNLGYDCPDWDGDGSVNGTGCDCAGLCNGATIYYTCSTYPYCGTSACGTDNCWGPVDGTCLCADGPTGVWHDCTTCGTSACIPGVCNGGTNSGLPCPQGDECIGGGTCVADVSPCSEIPEGDCDCDGQVGDCNGDCGGTASLDNCSVCSGGNTGHTANSDIDCAGVCSAGDSGFCPTTTNFCTAGSSGNDTGASTDACGYCSGGQTGFETNYADPGCGCDVPGSGVYYQDQDGDGLAGGTAGNYCSQGGLLCLMTDTGQYDGAVGDTCQDTTLLSSNTIINALASTEGGYVNCQTPSGDGLTCEDDPSEECPVQTFDECGACDPCEDETNTCDDWNLSCAGCMDANQCGGASEATLPCDSLNGESSATSCCDYRSCCNFLGDWNGTVCTCDGDGTSGTSCNTDSGPGDCSETYDECGVCDGDNSTCADCTGTPNGSYAWTDCSECTLVIAQYCNNIAEQAGCAWEGNCGCPQAGSPGGTYGPNYQIVCGDGVTGCCNHSTCDCANNCGGTTPYYGPCAEGCGDGCDQVCGVSECSGDYPCGEANDCQDPPDGCAAVAYDCSTSYPCGPSDLQCDDSTCNDYINADDCLSIPNGCSTANICSTDSCDTYADGLQCDCTYPSIANYCWDGQGYCIDDTQCPAVLFIGAITNNLSSSPPTTDVGVNITFSVPIANADNVLGSTTYVWAWSGPAGSGSSTDPEPTFNFSQSGVHTVNVTVTFDPSAGGADVELIQTYDITICQYGCTDLSSCDYTAGNNCQYGTCYWPDCTNECSCASQWYDESGVDGTYTSDEILAHDFENNCPGHSFDVCDICNGSGYGACSGYDCTVDACCDEVCCFNYPVGWECSCANPGNGSVVDGFTASGTCWDGAGPSCCGAVDGSGFCTNCPDLVITPLFTYDPPSEESNNLTLVITGTSTTFGDAVPEPTVVTYAWDFGDTSTSTDQFPTHQYAQTGQYDVILTVTAHGFSGSHTEPAIEIDKWGCTDSGACNYDFAQPASESGGGIVCHNPSIDCFYDEDDDLTGDSGNPCTSACDPVIYGAGLPNSNFSIYCSGYGWIWEEGDSAYHSCTEDSSDSYPGFVIFYCDGNPPDDANCNITNAGQTCPSGIGICQVIYEPEDLVAGLEIYSVDSADVTVDASSSTINSNHYIDAYYNIDWGEGGDTISYSAASGELPDHHYNISEDHDGFTITMYVSAIVIGTGDIVNESESISIDTGALTYSGPTAAFTSDPPSGTYNIGHDLCDENSGEFTGYPCPNGDEDCGDGLCIIDIFSASFNPDISTPGSHPITEHLWTFGDGETSDSQYPIWTKDTTGYYGVQLRVTDSVGGWNVLISSNHFELEEWTAGCNDSAACNYDPSADELLPGSCIYRAMVEEVDEDEYSCTQLTTVSFGWKMTSFDADNTQYHVQLVQCGTEELDNAMYSWDYESDGSTDSTEPEPEVVFNAGTYLISDTVNYDQDGTPMSKTCTFPITPGPPDVEFTADPEASDNATKTVTFINETSDSQAYADFMALNQYNFYCEIDGQDPPYDEELASTCEETGECDGGTCQPIVQYEWHWNDESPDSTDPDPDPHVYPEWSADSGLVESYATYLVANWFFSTGTFFGRSDNNLDPGLHCGYDGCELIDDTTGVEFTIPIYDITGTVLINNGSPLHGATVECSGAEEGFDSNITDVNGEFICKAFHGSDVTITVDNQEVDGVVYTSFPTEGIAISVEGPSPDNDFTAYSHPTAEGLVNHPVTRIQGEDNYADNILFPASDPDDDSVNLQLICNCDNDWIPCADPPSDTVCEGELFTGIDGTVELPDDGVTVTYTPQLYDDDDDIHYRAYTTAGDGTILYSHPGLEIAPPKVDLAIYWVPGIDRFEMDGEEIGEICDDTDPEYAGISCPNGDADCGTGFCIVGVTMNEDTSVDVTVVANNFFEYGCDWIPFEIYHDFGPEWSTPPNIGFSDGYQYTALGEDGPGENECQATFRIDPPDDFHEELGQNVTVRVDDPLSQGFDIKTLVVKIINVPDAPYMGTGMVHHPAGSGLPVIDSEFYVMWAGEDIDQELDTVTFNWQLKLPGEEVFTSQFTETYERDVDNDNWVENENGDVEIRSYFNEAASAATWTHPTPGPGITCGEETELCCEEFWKVEVTGTYDIDDGAGEVEVTAVTVDGIRIFCDPNIFIIPNYTHNTSIDGPGPFREIEFIDDSWAPAGYHVMNRRWVFGDTDESYAEYNIDGSVVNSFEDNVTITKIYPNYDSDSPDLPVQTYNVTLTVQYYEGFTYYCNCCDGEYDAECNYDNVGEDCASGVGVCAQDPATFSENEDVDIYQTWQIMTDTHVGGEIYHVPFKKHSEAVVLRAVPHPNYTFSRFSLSGDIELDENIYSNPYSFPLTMTHTNSESYASNELIVSATFNPIGNGDLTSTNYSPDGDTPPVEISELTEFGPPTTNIDHTGNSSLPFELFFDQYTFSITLSEEEHLLKYPARPQNAAIVRILECLDEECDVFEELYPWQVPTSITCSGEGSCSDIPDLYCNANYTNGCSWDVGTGQCGGPISCDDSSPPCRGGCDTIWSIYSSVDGDGQIYGLQFYKNGRYKAILRLYDIFGNYNEMTSIFFVNRLYEIVPSVPGQYAPWQGFNITGDATNELSYADLNDLDPRPRLGLFYWDDIQPTDWAGIKEERELPDEYILTPPWNIEWSSGGEWSPDVDARSVMSLDNNLDVPIFKYYDSDSELNPVEYENTSAPINVRFQFYPREGGDVFDDRAIELDSDKLENYYIAFIDWDDDSELDFQTPTGVIESLTTHRYADWGVYDITGYMLYWTGDDTVRFKKFTFKLNLNKSIGYTDEFESVGGDDYVFLPYDDTVPVVGGISLNSLYYRMVKKLSGGIDDQVADTRYMRYRDELRTQIALNNMDEDFLGVELEQFRDIVRDEDNNNDIIHYGYGRTAQELGDHLGDVDIGQVRAFKAPMQMWEILGFEEDDAGNPGHERYWQNIIPEDHALDGRSGMQHTDDPDALETDLQIWDPEYYYPVLPKLNRFGKFDPDLGLQNDGLNTPFGTLGRAWDGDDEDALITNLYPEHPDLVFDLNFFDNRGDHYGDNSGMESQAILINDFNVKLDENRHPKRVKFPILSQLEEADEEKVF